MAKKSDFYWLERENEWIKQQMKLDKQMSKEVQRVLENAIREIDKEIRANWDNFSNGQKISMSEAKKRANEMDVEQFAKKAKEYVKNKDFSPQANKELKLYNLVMRVNRLELLKAQIGLELIAAFDEIEKYGNKEMLERAIKEFERQAGILGMSAGADYTQQAERIIKASFNDSQYATFSENIWQNFTEMKLELEKILTRGITTGKNPRAIAKELQGFLKPNQQNTKYKLERLMRTEMAKIQIDIQQANYEQYDIKQYEYIAEPSACPDCAFLNGKVFSVKNMQTGKNAPPMHPNCRCSTASHVDRRAFEKSLEERGL